MSSWPPREGVPDLEAHLRPLRRIVERWGWRRLIIGVAGVAALLWLASGLYIVGPGERGVELLFGRIESRDPVMRKVLLDTELVVRGSCGGQPSTNT